MSDLSSRGGCGCSTGCGCSNSCGCSGFGGEFLQLDLDHPSSVLLLWKRQRIPGKQRLWM